MKKSAILIVLCLICTSLFAKSYEYYTWSRKIPNTYVSLHLEVFCPHDENIDENATKKMDELQTSFEKSPEIICAYYTYIGSLTDFRYLVQFSNHSLPTSRNICEWYTYSKIEIFDRNYEKIYSDYYDSWIDLDKYKYLVYKYLNEVYPPNFKVGDYINELDATVFKIDGTNVTLYHRENRDVTYSALETFCKNYQKDGYSGWRLPTIDEMNYMYTYRINSGTYWASTAKPEEHWAMDLVSGKWYKDYYTKLNVFVVKSLDVATINDYFPPPIKEPEKKIDEELRHNFKIGDYMPSCGTVFNVVGNKVYVFNKVYDYYYSDGNGYYAGCYPFAGAKECCKNSTTGGYTDWRLPTAQELNLIYTNRNAIPASFDEKYWTSSPGKGGKPQYLYFGNGTWITGTELTTCSVIAVREFDF